MGLTGERRQNTGVGGGGSKKQSGIMCMEMACESVLLGASLTSVTQVFFTPPSDASSKFIPESGWCGIEGALATVVVVNGWSTVDITMHSKSSWYRRIDAV